MRPKKSPPKTVRSLPFLGRASTKMPFDVFLRRWSPEPSLRRNCRRAGAKNRKKQKNKKIRTFFCQMPTLYTCRRSVLCLTKPELFRQPFDLSPNQTTCEVYHDAQNERNRHNKKHFRSIQTHPPAAGHRSDATQSAPCETSDRIAAHIAQ